RGEPQLAVDRPGVGPQGQRVLDRRERERPARGHRDRTADVGSVATAHRSGGITIVPHVPVRIRHGWLIAIAGVYLYLFPYFPRINSANELPRVYLVKAIVEDHSFAIDRQVQRYGATSDLSRWDGHLYQNKAPGSSLLV